MDYELVPTWVLTAFNVTYDLAATRSHITGQWGHDSLFGLSGAIAVQVVQGVFLGVEGRYAGAYGGLAFDHFDGHALFVGPSAYRKPRGSRAVCCPLDVDHDPSLGQFACLAGSVHKMVQACLPLLKLSG
jgi:hypothetical protein